jgi:hypothetical protein
MDKQTVAQAFAHALTAWRNCQKSGNETWEDKWWQRMEQLQDCLPSGGGFDSGSTFDADASTATKLVFATSFHHMGESGMYDGWTEHRVTFRASFVSPEITISGRDRNRIKDYIAEVFSQVLGETAPDRED